MHHGVGIGLRRPHYHLLSEWPDHGVPFWEISPENHIGEGGRDARLAGIVFERDPILTHGLALSIGGFDPWDQAYLRELNQLIQRTGSPWHSEHLCFTSVDGIFTHELLPLPFTPAAARHAAQRAREVQQSISVPLLLENITYYAELGQAALDEADFITDVLEDADCGWLLDVNNVYVNSVNFGFDPRVWLARMPLQRVRQMHIAGHERFDGLVIDTHGTPVIDPVVELMQWTLSRIGRPVPVLLERDNHIPELDELLAERQRIQIAYDQVLAVEPSHA